METKTKHMLRDKYLQYCNERRQRSGKPRLEELPNNEQLLELDDGFGYVYEQMSRGRNKSFINNDDNIKDKNKLQDQSSQRVSKRKAKEQNKQKDYDHSSIADKYTDAPYEFIAQAELPLSDPQGYAK